MEEFLEFVLRHLIEFPDEMVITHHEEPKKIVFHLRLRKSDIGKVIGKGGHIIEALRNLLSAAASRHGKRAVLEIIEERSERAERPAAPPADTSVADTSAPQSA